jgi:hypothetical protein
VAIVAIFGGKPLVGDQALHPMRKLSPSTQMFAKAVPMMASRAASEEMLNDEIKSSSPELDLALELIRPDQRIDLLASLR